MSDPKQEVTEAIQRMAARLLATTHAGFKLALIGGFRYRLLDQGPRISRDIDYHWAGDLVAKRDELVDTFRRRLLPEVRRKFGYSGSASPHTGPEGQSPAVSAVMLAFWRDGEESSRIELPVEITRVRCTDDLVVKAVDGVVYPTASDQDMIENKIVAIFARSFLQHRDLVDLFMFASHLAPSSPERIERKLAELGLDCGRATKRLDDLSAGQGRHIGVIDNIIDTQVEAEVAANLTRGGGGAMVFDRVIEILRQQTSGFMGGVR
jgi:hypothetical protein